MLSIILCMLSGELARTRVWLVCVCVWAFLFMCVPLPSFLCHYLHMEWRVVGMSDACLCLSGYEWCIYIYIYICMYVYMHTCASTSPSSSACQVAYPQEPQGACQLCDCGQQQQERHHPRLRPRTALYLWKRPVAMCVFKSVRCHHAWGSRWVCMCIYTSITAIQGGKGHKPNTRLFQTCCIIRSAYIYAYLIKKYS